jgi:hypothetical protein
MIFGLALSLEIAASIMLPTCLLVVAKPADFCEPIVESIFGLAESNALRHQRPLVF